jgi:chitinase
MMGFTSETGPKIWPQVDFINVMSYDLVNRRNKMTWHHTSVVDSEDTIKNYLAIGAPADKLNLGFAYYAKYFTTEDNCSATSPLNCTLVPAEDAAGKDTKTSGTWTFEKQNMVLFDPKTLSESTNGLCGPALGTKCPKGNCCSEYGYCGTGEDFCSGACWHAFGTGCTGKDIAGSWQQAAANSVADDQAGGQYYFDDTNKLF